MMECKRELQVAWLEGEIAELKDREDQMGFILETMLNVILHR